MLRILVYGNPISLDRICQSVLEPTSPFIIGPIQLPLSLVGKPFPVKEVDFGQRSRTISEDEHRAQTIC